jgi:hypothetical protein
MGPAPVGGEVQRQPPLRPLNPPQDVDQPAPTGAVARLPIHEAGEDISAAPALSLPTGRAVPSASVDVPRRTSVTSEDHLGT